ncbi:molybdenum cofactor guanylyltransferase [Cohnella sp. JJ-181]|uniref:molybdenum cofactor guanylyltransferase n=1 Tax=Cohnella rhizoplanae TaxID=2974897 RepID=UPI0022FFBA74|nr:molybdenum cofactor guanylyltransferase [Cohnella sp. JJ-181]CAI6035696.1 Molybdenum cofactor guanylyltransferase [Cohnella sp. JJ-181]
MSSASVTGAILAGGPNSLLGGTLKALLPLQEEPLIVRQVREMRKLCKEIIVVTDTPKPFFDVLDGSVRMITDYFPGRGPLGGMHSALRLARNPLVWIVGSDMPFVSAEEARRLMMGFANGVQAVIPIVRDRPVPLHGLYDSRCSEAVAALLTAGGESIEALLGRLHWLGVPSERGRGKWGDQNGPDSSDKSEKTDRWERSDGSDGSYGTDRADGTDGTDGLNRMVVSDGPDGPDGPDRPDRPDRPEAWSAFSFEIRGQPDYDRARSLLTLARSTG